MKKVFVMLAYGVLLCVCVFTTYTAYMDAPNGFFKCLLAGAICGEIAVGGVIGWFYRDAVK